MMWTPGGQIDHITFAGLRKGGGGSNPYEETTLTDPVTGQAFTSSPWSVQHGGQSAANQLNAEIKQRTDQATADKAAADAKATSDHAQAESDFQTNKTKAYNDAMTGIMKSFTNAGLDPNQYMDSYIKPTLDRINSGISDIAPDATTAPNVSSSYDPNLGATILGTATSDARSRALGQFNQSFAPNYANTALPTSLLTDPINQILKEQFDPLGQELINAQKRGTLTDVGYKAAVDALNQKRAAGQSQLQTLGANILSGERSNLNDLISGGRSDINNMNLGQQIDPGSYVSQAQGQVGSDISGLGGALRSAAGNTQFADLTDLLNAGGSVQGAGNPTAANPTGLPGAGGTAPLTADQQLAQQRRGLGSKGAF